MLGQHDVKVQSECEGLLTVVLEGNIMNFHALLAALPPHNSNVTTKIDGDLECTAIVIEFSERGVSWPIWDVIERGCMMAVPMLLAIMFRDVLGFTWLNGMSLWNVSGYGKGV